MTGAPYTNSRTQRLLEEAFAAGKAAGILEERKMYCADPAMREHDYEPRIQAFYHKLDELKATIGVNQ